VASLSRLEASIGDRLDRWKMEVAQYREAGADAEANVLAACVRELTGDLLRPRSNGEGGRVD
jgi:hypothetical protein